MYILFDIGKTNLRLAVSKDKKSFDRLTILHTPDTLEQTIDLLLKTAKEITSDEILGFSGGITAVLDESRGINTMKLIQEKIGSKAYVTNDAAVVSLGEAEYGAGKGFDNVACLVVGTGIGGARVSNGSLDMRDIGFEPGHQIICYKTGESLEGLVSGKAIQKKYGKNPKEVLDPQVWKDLGKILAVGVYNSTLHWMPDAFVLGGSMVTGSPAISLEETQNYLKEINTVLPKLPIIKKAELGDRAGIYGSLSLL